MRRTNSRVKAQFAVVVAAGQGRRMGFKKQFVHLAGRPMWLRSVDAMLYREGIRVIVVTGQSDVPAMMDEIGRQGMQSVCTIAPGGATRHESVVVGIQHVIDMVEKENLDKKDVLVAVHDAARPFVSAEDVRRVCDRALEHGAAILGMYCRDTVKWVESDAVERTLPREHLFLAQTPQVIRGDLLELAYFQTGSTDSPLNESPTDDSSLLEANGYRVACVESTGYNGKLTTPVDLEYAEWMARTLWGTS